MLSWLPRPLRPAFVVGLAIAAAVPIAPHFEPAQWFVAIGLMLVWLPLVLVGWLDLVSEANEAAAAGMPRGLVGRSALAPARLTLGGLGVSGIVFGVAVILWILFNRFVERRPEFTGGIAWLQPLGIAPALIGGGVAMLRSAIGRDEPESFEIQEQAEQDRAA